MLVQIQPHGTRQLRRNMKPSSSEVRMAIRSCVVDSKAKTMTIVMDMDPPAPSKSGKTQVVATSRGNQPTTGTIGGKVVYLGVNAYIK